MNDIHVMLTLLKHHTLIPLMPTFHESFNMVLLCRLSRDSLSLIWLGKPKTY